MLNILKNTLATLLLCGIFSSGLYATAFPLGDVVDDSTTYTATVDGITMTINNPIQHDSVSGVFSDDIVTATGFWFGHAPLWGIDAVSFDVTFDTDVTLDRYASTNSVLSTGVTFSISGPGVNSTGNSLSAGQQSGVPPLGGALTLTANTTYTFSVETVSEGNAGSFAQFDVTAAAPVAPAPTAVPTLSEWAAIGLGVGLGILGLLFGSRRIEQA